MNISKQIKIVLLQDCPICEPFREVSAPSLLDGSWPDFKPKVYIIFVDNLVIGAGVVLGK